MKKLAKFFNMMPTNKGEGPNSVFMGAYFKFSAFF